MWFNHSKSHDFKRLCQYLINVGYLLFLISLCKSARAPRLILVEDGQESINHPESISQLLGFQDDLRINVVKICLFYLLGVPESGQVAWTVAWNRNVSCTPRVVTLPILPTTSCLKGVKEPHLFTPDKACLGPLGVKNIICQVLPAIAPTVLMLH